MATPRKRVKIDKDLEILFMNNLNGNYFYRDDKTGDVYDLSNYGDKEYITVGQLRRMKNSHPTHLEAFWIYLLEVDDDEVELEDVLTYLGLSSVYEKSITPEQVEGMLMKMNPQKFAELIADTKYTFLALITERAIALYKEDKFNHMGKMQTLAKSIGKNVDELFYKNEEM